MSGVFTSEKGKNIGKSQLLKNVTHPPQNISKYRCYIGYYKCYLGICRL